MTAKAVVLMMLMLAMSLLAISLPGTSHAQNLPQCRFSKILPLSTAEHGKDSPYMITYQSGGGESCRMYRTHNFPGHPSTAVLWKTANETLLDVVLPACPTNTVCPWVMTSKMGQFSEIGTSTMAYGKAHEYSHTAQTFVAKGLDAGEFPEYRTLLEGVIPGSGGKFTAVIIEVTSQVEGSGPYRLTYRLSLNASKLPIPARAHLVLEPPDRVSIWSAKDKTREPANLTVAWGAVTENLFKRGAGKPALPVLSEHSPEAVATISAGAIKAKRIPLVIRSGEQQFAMTTAPAYLPVK